MQRSADTMSAVRSRRTPPARVLLALLGLLSLSVPAYIIVPLPAGIHQLFYDGIAAVAVTLGFLGLVHHRPERRRGWFLVLLGYAGWVAGDLVWTAEQSLLPGIYPVPSDAVYLSSYVALGAGALLFVRTRRTGGRDIAALLDASIITVGAGVLAGVFLIAPLADDSTLSLAGKIAVSAYPLGDLFLLGVLIRTHNAAGARTASYRLLTASLVAVLSADVGWNVLTLLSGPSNSSLWTDTGWLASYILVAAAACVPSMKTLAEPAPDRAEGTPTRRRLAILAVGSTLPGVALLLQGVWGADVQWPIIGAGTLLLSGLVLVRMVGLLRIVEVQAVRLAALAGSDYLTGAPNRRTWDHELSLACKASREQGTTLSVAILDLDRFKVYNDSQGHQAGDRLLREAVAAWTEALPPQALLARYGGEEFALLVPGASAHDVSRLLHRLRLVTPGGQTFSAGIAVWSPETDPGTAIAAADEALYAAKRGGRDRIVVSGRAASQNPDSILPSFSMVIQPIVDITTMAVTSHEALARFTDPKNLDVLEVFRRAYADGHGDLLELAAVQAALDLPGRPDGHDLYVNVSARAITSQRFLDGLPARLNGVVIELNEDPDQIDPAMIAQAVAGLRARGARIALDDVGAGAQEFARLATLRPDIIKVDRSLVDGCANDSGCTAVLRALITYADELGLTICAEGVEELADLRHLTELGITHAQGYLLARPGTKWRRQISPAALSAAVAVA